MDIGLAKETAASGRELRVALLPPEVKKIVKEGHNVFVQKGAGEGIFVANAEYKKAGAKIKEDTATIFSKDFVIKLKCPTNSEFRLLKNNIIFSMLHIEQNPRIARTIKKSGSKAIAMENVRNQADERLIQCTDMGGEQAMLYAFCEAMKLPQDCNVLVLGYGAIASGALKAAFSLGANVKILRKREYQHIRHHLKEKDIVVNGLSWPKYHRDRKDYVITKKMLNLLNKGASILDLSVDYPNPIQTCRPTQLNEPYYYVNGVKHVCIYGYPGLAPISSAQRYSKQICPIVIDLANNGLKKCDISIRKAIVKT